MRWETKSKEQPQYGDKRTVKRFAWVPTEVGRFTIFLERYSQEQRFSNNGTWVDTPARSTIEYYY